MRSLSLVDVGIQDRLFRAEVVEQDKQHEKARLRTKDISRRKVKGMVHSSDWVTACLHGKGMFVEYIVNMKRQMGKL